MSNPELIEWTARIEAEYREMPGLRLTMPQMQRLWGLDLDACAELVAVLVARGVLRESAPRTVGVMRAAMILRA